MTISLTPSPAETTLMPSPLSASAPRNASEAHIKQLIDEALTSGKPAEYDNVASFMRQTRSQSQARRQLRNVR